MADYFDVLLFSLIGGILSLAGGLVLMRKQSTATKLALYGTPFAAGALLAAAFFDLLPESAAKLGAETASLWILGGLLAFFFLEHFIHWFHHTHDNEQTDEPQIAPLIILGDSIHNMLDGIAIGAAFLISVPTGIVTAIAVAAHEIPQEIGDFGLLLKAGYSRKRVLIINAISALMATVGAMLTFWIGSNTGLPLGQLLAVTAGMFIYIAASDIIPHLHSHKGKLAHSGALLLIFGVLIVGLTTRAVHDYIDTGHDHNDTHSHSESEDGDDDHGHDHADDEDDH